MAPSDKINNIVKQQNLPKESLLLLAPELLVPLIVTEMLLGLENWPLDGLLNLLSRSTSDRRGLFGWSCNVHDKI